MLYYTYETISDHILQWGNSINSYSLCIWAVVPYQFTGDWSSKHCTLFTVTRPSIIVCIPSTHYNTPATHLIPSSPYIVINLSSSADKVTVLCNKSPVDHPSLAYKWPAVYITPLHECGVPLKNPLSGINICQGSFL